MERNPAAVFGDVGTSEDVAVLTRAGGDAEPVVREHAAWALARLHVVASRDARVGAARAET
jgi:epoxyqueuosine reductase